MLSFMKSVSVLLFLSSASALGAAERPQYVATSIPTGARIVIDGKLDESAWSLAKPSEPFQWVESHRGQETFADTSFRILRDDDAIYVGVFCHEPFMSKIVHSPIHRDGPVWLQDSIEIHVAPDGSPVNFYQFMVSAGNSLADIYWIEGGTTTIGEYNGVVQTAVHRQAHGWSVEMRLPVTAFFHTSSRSFTDSWRFNVARGRKAESAAGDNSSWSLLRRAFNESERYGTLTNVPGKSPKLDMVIRDVQVHINGVGQSGNGYQASLSIPVTATADSAGACRLDVAVDDRPLLTNDPVNVPAGASIVSVNKVLLDSMGQARRNFHVRFYDASNQTIAEAIYPVRLDYSPMVVTLDEPCYGQAIFPGQEIDRIAGSVKINLPENVLKGAMVRIGIDGPGMNAASLEMSADQGAVRFSFDASQVSLGDHPLTVEVVQGDTVMARRVMNIPKLPQPQGSCVYIDRHRRVVVDGQPMILRSWYGDSRFLMSQAMIDRYGDRPSSPYVNAWMSWVVMEAERFDRSEAASGRMRQDIKPSDRVFDEIAKSIQANRQSKTIRFYYLSDEPECRGISPVYLKHLYDYIKKLDPYRPVMIITRAPEKYVGCADILNPHPYLSPTVDARGVRRMKSPKQVRDQMRTVLAAGHGRIPAWFTPQAFSYGEVDPLADTPNFIEYRCMMWTAIINGATGFTPFNYNRHFMSIDLRHGCDFVYETMSHLDDFLLSTEKSPAVHVVAKEDGVDAMVKTANGKRLIAAVNLLDTKVRAEIHVADAAGVQTLYGFREEGSHELKDGRLILDFEPYQVHLLTSVPADRNLSSTSQVIKKIEQERAALSKPGNILFNRGREIEWNTSDTYLGNRAIDSLTDGLTDSLGWVSWRNRQLPAWVEAQFPTFTAVFKTAKVYSATIRDMELQAWEKGQWVTLASVTDNQEPVITFVWKEPVRTVKLRLWITRVRPDTKADVYEIELYP